MLEAERLAGFGEVPGLVAGAIVEHHPRDRDAEAVVISDCSLEEGNGADGLFVWEDIGEGDAGGIVDADTNIPPAEAARIALAGPVAGDPGATRSKQPRRLMSRWIKPQAVHIRSVGSALWRA